MIDKREMNQPSQSIDSFEQRILFGRDEFPVILKIIVDQKRNRILLRPTLFLGMTTTCVASNDCPGRNKRQCTPWKHPMEIAKDNVPMLRNARSGGLHLVTFDNKPQFEPFTYSDSYRFTSGVRSSGTLNVTSFSSSMISRSWYFSITVLPPVAR